MLLCEACGRLAADLTDTGVGSDIRRICDGCLNNENVLICWACRTIILQSDAVAVPTGKGLGKVCKACRQAMMGN